MSIRCNTPTRHILDFSTSLGAKITAPADLTDKARTPSPANSAVKQRRVYFYNFEYSQKFEDIT